MSWTEEMLIPSVIRAVDADGVKAYCPNMGQTVNMTFDVMVPDKVPKVGSLWWLERVERETFVLRSEMHTGGVSLMELGMSVDLGDVWGREERFVSDMVDLGVSELFITVASRGECHWASEVGESLGMDCSKANLEQVLGRLDKTEIRVYLCLSATMFGEGHELCQRRISDSGYEDTSYLSPSLARDAVVQMAEELSVLGEVAGMLIDGMRVSSTESAFGDASPACLAEFYNRTGVMPAKAADIPKDLLLEWVDVQQSALASFVSSVDSATRFPFGVMLDFGRYGGDVMCGVRYNHTGELPCPIAGAWLSYEQSHDKSIELRSLAYHAACVDALVQGMTIVGIDIEDVDSWDDVFHVLSMRDVRHVVLGDYLKFADMHEVDRQAMRRAYEQWAVTDMYSGASSAVVVSDDSSLGRLVMDGDSDALNGTWWSQAERLHAMMSMSLGQRVDVILDSRMDSYTADYRCVAYADANMMTDEDMARLVVALDDDGQGIVFVGGDDDSMMDVFSSKSGGEAEFSDVTLPDDVPVFGGDSYCSDGSFSGESLFQSDGSDGDGKFPVARLGNDYYVPIEPTDDRIVLAAIGDIAAASVSGR